MVDLWRGGLLEGQHFGHAVICDERGEIIEAWGNPDLVMFPRSASKMIQALPLLESGAGRDLTTEQLALSCASHAGMPMHTTRVERWLADLGLTHADLRCGTHDPTHPETRNALIKSDTSPCPLHNNCSGKHAGFLTLNAHLGGHSEYIEVDHPVQIACKAAIEEVTGITAPGYGIDGCSAPNFATTLHGLARAMAAFATATDSGDSRQRAAHKLTCAMMTHPELVSGEGRAPTELMQALPGEVAVKTGAEGVFVAILPKRKRSIALKISDGAARASEAVMAALLVRLGVMSADHPAAQRMQAVQVNCAGRETGVLRITPGFL
jgi:L-asparaginase II